MRSYKLSFGINKGLEITEGVTIVEGYMHFDPNSDTDRVTLIYKGLGSFTFTLKKATSLALPNQWHGEYLKRRFQTTLTYSAKTKVLEGKGLDDNDNNVGVKIVLEPKEEDIWGGYYETEEEMVGIVFTYIRIDNFNNTLSAEIEDSDALVEGTVGRKDRKHHTFPVDFTITDDDEVKAFKGTMDISQS